MPPDKTGGRSVFIGNIPYNLTEEQIKELLSSAGTVTKFRLMTDNETGKPKGFGFADFADAEEAASAVRNLDEHEIMGRRIKVSFPHSKDSVPSDYPPQTQMPANGADSSQQGQSSALPPLPPGTELGPGLSCTDSISKTLSTLSPQQLLDVLTQMKTLATSDPVKATELLRQAPQLSYAIFQSLLLMNLVDSQVLVSVVEQASQPNMPSQNIQVAQPQPPPQQIPHQMPPQQMPQQYQQQYPPPIPTHAQISTPPVHAQPYPPPQPQPPQQQAAPVMSQEELIKQVLAMPQEQIEQLPPVERGQIMMLKQQLMAQGIR